MKKALLIFTTTAMTASGIGALWFMLWALIYTWRYSVTKIKWQYSVDYPDKLDLWQKMGAYEMVIMYLIGMIVASMILFITFILLGSLIRRHITNEGVLKFGTWRIGTYCGARWWRLSDWRTYGVNWKRIQYPNGVYKRRNFGPFLLWEEQSTTATNYRVDVVGNILNADTYPRTNN